MYISQMINDNKLLNTLLQGSSALFSSNLKLIYLKEGECLLQKSKHLTFSYFPTTAVLSNVFSTDQVNVEIEAIRNDGICGLPPNIDSRFSSQVLVQSSGYAYEIPTSILEKETHISKEILQILLKFQQLRIDKISQICVCSKFHTIEQQCCRILLNVMDHSYNKTIELTHKTIANKLNVRREGVTTAIAKMQRDGILKTFRGSLIVLDRRRLEEKACECYTVLHDASEDFINSSLSLMKRNYSFKSDAIKNIQYPTTRETLLNNLDFLVS